MRASAQAVAQTSSSATARNEFTPTSPPRKTPADAATANDSIADARRGYGPPGSATLPSPPPSPIQRGSGPPMASAGFFAEARPLARKMVEVFEPYEHVVCPSGSCPSMVRNHFDRSLPGVDALRAKTRELCEFLHDVLQIRPKGRFPHRVGLHQSCHGLRELRLGSGSERLAPPFGKVRPPRESIEGLQLV